MHGNPAHWHLAHLYTTGVTGLYEDRTQRRGERSSVRCNPCGLRSGCRLPRHHRIVRKSIMEFIWINKQGVQNDDGEIVQFTGRFTMEYRNGAKVLELGIESVIRGGASCIQYRRSDFEKWSKGGGLLSPAEKERARTTFREALKFQGLVPDEE